MKFKLEDDSVLENLELYEVDTLYFKSAEYYYIKLINQLDPRAFKEIRTEFYWILHDRFFEPKSIKHNRMKLFIYFYIAHINDYVLDENYLLLVSKDERIKKNSKGLVFNNNF